MNLTEHTGHGIPTILSKYGEKAFDINESYFQVTFLYDQYVLESIESKKTSL